MFKIFNIHLIELCIHRKYMYIVIELLKSLHFSIGDLEVNVSNYILQTKYLFSLTFSHILGNLKMKDDSWSPKANNEDSSVGNSHNSDGPSEGNVHYDENSFNNDANLVSNDFVKALKWKAPQWKLQMVIKFLKPLEIPKNSR